MKETLENLSKTQYKPEFRVQYKKLGEEVQEEVAEAVGKLVSSYLTEPWNHPQVKFIPYREGVWRLKLGSRGEAVDHRVFFDVDDEGLIFLSVIHRDQAYQS